MLKKYTSKSHVCLSLTFKNGGHGRVSFSPLTGGGSVYYTDDESMQWALAHHPKCGKLYKVTVITPVAEPEPVKAPMPKNPEAGASDEPTVMKIEVTCLDDAKDYLCETYGYSRTKLRTGKAIKEAAASHGIEFIGLK